MSHRDVPGRNRSRKGCHKGGSHVGQGRAKPVRGGWERSRRGRGGKGRHGRGQGRGRQGRGGCARNGGCGRDVGPSQDDSWTKTMTPTVVEKFQQPSGPSVLISAVVLEVFRLFFTTTLIDLIVDQSNLYTSQLMSAEKFDTREKITAESMRFAPISVS